jgi:hypothetical protein
MTRHIQPSMTHSDLHDCKFDPLGSFRMLLYPDVALMLTFSSLVYVEYYWVLTTYSTLLSSNYGYNDIQIGLCYLSVVTTH